MGFCDNLRTASAPVYLLVMVFAMSTWVDIVGIWVEMPLMVTVLPEHWDLPAYLTVIIQCANVGPAIYATVDKIRSTKNKAQDRGRKDINYDVGVTFVIIIVAFVSMFLMSFFWPMTMWLFGAMRSIPFMVLVLFTSIVSCMSSVVFLPYMARFKPVYIAAYYIGQGLCGLVPGMVGLVQGVGRQPDCVNVTVTVFNETSGENSTYIKLRADYQPPLFSVNAFLRFLAAIIFASGIAFACLNYAAFCKREMTQTPRPAVTVSSPNAIMSSSKDEVMQPSTDSDSREGEHLLNPQAASNGVAPSNGTTSVYYVKSCDAATESHTDVVIVTPSSTTALSRSHFALLLTMVGVVNAMTNGILPATQSYTCLPFGNLVYTLSIRLSSVAGPLASLSSMFLPRASLRVVTLLTSLAVAIAAFHLCLAAQSPQPMLKGTIMGQVLVIVSSVMMSSMFSFVRVSVASILREKGGRRELLWCGGITQVGSFCGAVVTFILVSILHVFLSDKPCSKA